MKRQTDPYGKAMKTEVNKRIKQIAQYFGLKTNLFQAKRKMKIKLKVRYQLS